VPTGGDSFDSGALDKTKWNAIVREQADLYEINDGWLEMETVNGDIYTGGNPAPTRNFILQEPTEANQDWVIETHVDAATLSGGYEQAGLMVYADDDNYIKFDIISDDGQTVLNRLELRSEIGGAIQQPQPVDPPVPAGETDVWLRLTKTGTSYAGEYSFDGVTYQDVNIPVTNPMVDPAFGIFTLGVNSGGGTARFEYFSLNGSTGCEEPEPENQAPVIEDVAASPQTGFAPLEVDFTVDASDPDEGDTLTYAWDFDGDGDTDSTQEDPTHTYTAEGEYEAEVTVSDGEAERSRTVTVDVFGPDDPQARFRVLVFSQTAGFRHDSIDEGHAAIEELGADNDFQVDHTEDAAIFNAAALARYDTVVFLSTTGDVLNAAQQTAFENYIQAGGGFTGIHAAADTEYDWKWYGRMIGAYFHSHPPGTPTANVIVEDTDDHTTQGLPLTWTRTDEWYNYKRVDFETDGSDYSPRNSGVHVLLRLDESTYDEQDGNTTDDDHPISWCQRYEGGRSWYTGMGHTAASFGTAPGNIRSHILGGIEVSAGAADSAECGAADPNAPIVEAFGEPTSGTAPLTVEFSSSALDPNGPGSGLRYRWEFGDDSSALGPNPVHTYTQPGNYEAVLTVTDAEGLQTSRTVEITVNPAGTQAPVVDVAADPGRGVAPLAVQFQAAATDPDGDESKLVYRWNFGDGAGSSFAQNPKHTYMTPGTYDATVTVTDAAGASTTSDPITITVENPPGNVAPNVEAAADPTSGTAPLRVQFTAAATDPDGDHVLITWNFGDQTGGAGAAVAHTYTTPGVYNAVVTVRDQGGLTDTATVQVTVTGATGAGGSPPANLAPQGGNTGAGGSPPANVAPQGGDVASETVRVTKRHKVARVIKRGLRYTVACEAACRVTSTLRIAGADNQRLGKAAARSIAAGASRAFVLRLDRKVRRNLVSAMRKAKLRNLRATLVLKIRTAEGTTTVRKAVVLRR
jgi:PKD repeat protein